MNMGYWYGVSQKDPRAIRLFARHYSATKNGSTTREWLKHGIVAPGPTIVLMTPDCLALFVWVKERYIKNDQTGPRCAVFRNEGSTRSSDLILEAEQFAWTRWPGERLYTYVDPGAVTSHNPGYCFKQAGWSLVRDGQGKPRTTTRGLLILEKLPL